MGLVLFSHCSRFRKNRYLKLLLYTSCAINVCWLFLSLSRAGSNGVLKEFTVLNQVDAVEAQLKAGEIVSSAPSQEKQVLDQRATSPSKERSITTLLPAKSRRNPFVDIEFDPVQVGAFSLKKTFKVSYCQLIQCALVGALGHWSNSRISGSATGLKPANLLSTECL